MKSNPLRAAPTHDGRIDSTRQLIKSWQVPGSGCASNESMSSYWFFSVEAAKCLEEQKCLSLIAVEEANHFESLAKCHNVCEISSVQKRPKSMDFQLKDCLLEPKAGGCDRNLKR